MVYFPSSTLPLRPNERQFALALHHRAPICLLRPTFCEEEVVFPCFLYSLPTCLNFLAATRNFQYTVSLCHSSRFFFVGTKGSMICCQVEGGETTLQCNSKLQTQNHQIVNLTHSGFCNLSIIWQSMEKQQFFVSLYIFNFLVFSVIEEYFSLFERTRFDISQDYVKIKLAYVPQMTNRKCTSLF